MSVLIPLRADYVAAAPRRAAKTTKHAAQGRRLLALAEIYDGGTRTDAGRIGGVGLKAVRDWVLAFNAAGPAGLVDGKARGNAPKLNEAQRRALAGVKESGSMPANRVLPPTLTSSTTADTHGVGSSSSPGGSLVSGCEPGCWANSYGNLNGQDTRCLAEMLGLACPLIGEM